jgi:hypothetical protein
LLEFGKKPLKKKSENGGEKEKMNAKYKKSLKIVTLLITALLIATASAQVYRYMYISGTVTVGSAILTWGVGSVTPSVVGTTASITLNVEEEVPINFTDALYITNTDAVNGYDYTISILTAISGTDFSVANIHVYETDEATGPYVDTLDLTSSSDSVTGTLAASGVLSLTIEIEANSGVSSGSFQVQVQYEQA